MTDKTPGPPKPSLEQPRPKAQLVVLSDIPAGNPAGGAPIAQGNLSLVEGVKVKLDASLGSAELSVADLFALKRDSVVTLDATLDAPIELRLNGKLVARGQLVAVDDCFGLRITEIAAPAAAGKAG